MTVDFKYKKIKSDKTLSEKLKYTRKKFGYGLDYIEKETKINLKYLQFIEDGQWEKLPADVYIIGFLKRYSDFLYLNSQEIIQKFNQEKKLISMLNPTKKRLGCNDSILKPKSTENLNQYPSFVITPKVILSLGVIIFVVGMLSYIWYQVKGFAAAPPLELNQVTEQQIVKVESIAIAGQTDPGANLFINNQSVAVDQNGSFSQIIKLSNGINNIEITAKNKAQKETKKIIKILAEY